jgi:hypothetical protein
MLLFSTLFYNDLNKKYEFDIQSAESNANDFCPSAADEEI